MHLIFAVLLILGKDAKMISTARQVNTYKTERVIDKLKYAALEFKKEKSRKIIFVCMGSAFKGDIDDLHISDLPINLVDDNVIFGDANVSAANADSVLLPVNYQAFKDIGIGALTCKMVVDSRGLWEDRTLA